MPHWKTLIPSERPFLGWWDLIDQGDVNVVIEHVGIEPVWDNRLKKERDKIVLKLKGTKKKFVPNVTNIKPWEEWTDFAFRRSTQYDLVTAREEAYFDFDEVSIYGEEIEADQWYYDSDSPDDPWQSDHEWGSYNQ